jgi:hypothetical protein
MPRETMSYAMSRHYSILGLDRYVLLLVHVSEHSIYLSAVCDDGLVCCEPISFLAPLSICLSIAFKYLSKEALISIYMWKH